MNTANDAIQAMYREAIANQFAATLRTVLACLEACPADAWQAPVGRWSFDQAAFHAIFFADFYLSREEGDFQRQEFHQRHASMFRDYEELLPREQVNHYERPELIEYLDFCRRKAAETFATETAEALLGPCGFPRRGAMTRGELHIYNLRHLQHHASHLSLRLRIDHGVAIPWFASGWRD